MERRGHGNDLAQTGLNDLWELCPQKVEVNSSSTVPYTVTESVKKRANPLYLLETVPKGVYQTRQRLNGSMPQSFPIPSWKKSILRIGLTTPALAMSCEHGWPIA